MSQPNYPQYLGEHVDQHGNSRIIRSNNFDQLRNQLDKLGATSEPGKVWTGIYELIEFDVTVVQ